MSPEVPAIRVDRVASDRVEVSWDHTGNWSDVTVFTVNITSDDLNCSFDNVTCNRDCSFNSRKGCGALKPCTPYTVTVEGDQVESQVPNITTGIDTCYPYVPPRNFSYF